MKNYHGIPGEHHLTAFMKLWTAFQTSDEPVSCQCNDFRIILMYDHPSDDDKPIPPLYGDYEKMYNLMLYGVENPQSSETSTRDEG